MSVIEGADGEVSIRLEVTDTAREKAGKPERKSAAVRVVFGPGVKEVEPKPIEKAPEKPQETVSAAEEYLTKDLETAWTDYIFHHGRASRVNEARDKLSRYQNEGSGWMGPID